MRAHLDKQDIEFKEKLRSSTLERELEERFNTLHQELDDEIQKNKEEINALEKVKLQKETEIENYKNKVHQKEDECKELNEMCKNMKKELEKTKEVVSQKNEMMKSALLSEKSQQDVLGKKIIELQKELDQKQNEIERFKDVINSKEQIEEFSRRVDTTEVFEDKFDTQSKQEAGKSEPDYESIISSLEDQIKKLEMKAHFSKGDDEFKYKVKLMALENSLNDQMNKLCESYEDQIELKNQEISELQQKIK